MPTGSSVFGDSLAGSFDYVIAIDFNRRTGVSPLDGTHPHGNARGGGIWLHVDHDGPTHGCVSVPRDGMKALLRALSPKDKPIVVMGDKSASPRSRCSPGRLTPRRRRCLVTQNVDDLHERAGSERVHHLHGNLFRSRCLDDGCGFASHDTATHGGAVPTCPRCGQRLRPEMVLFGEAVDIDALWAAKRSVRYCDAFVAIGTSGLVHPASGLVRYAEDVGALTVCVDPGQADSLFQQHVALPADDSPARAARRHREVASGG